MATATFHDRIARLHAKYEANPVQKPEMAPHIEDVERAMKSAKKKKPARRFKASRLLTLPLMVLVGFALPIGASVIMFHFFPVQGGAEATDASAVLSILDTIGIDIVVSGLVMVLMVLSGLWLPMIAYGVGSYLAIFRETELMALYPEVWTLLFSPAYVSDALSYAEQATGML